jgi:hypothetical protein
MNNGSMDISEETIELLFTATESGIAILDGAFDFLRNLSIPEIEVMVSDEGFELCLAGKVMLSMSVEDKESFDIVRFNMSNSIEDSLSGDNSMDMENFEFALFLITKIVKNNAICRLKNLMMRSRKEVEVVLEKKEERADEDADFGWI